MIEALSDEAPRRPSSYLGFTCRCPFWPMIGVEMTSSCFKYVNCDVPAGMTLDEFRRRRVRPERPGLLARMRFWRH